jgi:hypothetical protein
MTPTNDGETLRALIRLIPPARRLREDLERVTATEVYDGIGDVTIQSLKRLVESLAGIAADPYVAGLAPNLSESATDKEKAWQAFLAAGQLVAYLEAQTGVVGGNGSSHVTVNQALSQIGEMNLPGVKTLLPLGKLAAAISEAAEQEGEEEPPR